MTEMVPEWAIVVRNAEGHATTIVQYAIYKHDRTAGPDDEWTRLPEPALFAQDGRQVSASSEPGRYLVDGIEYREESRRPFD